MKESTFQHNFIAKVKTLLPGCIALKNDAGYIQGMPDIIILHQNKWASLEFKKNRNAYVRPNQKYYVDKMNQMSFSRFVYPENEEEVLNELQQTFES